MRTPIAPFAPLALAVLALGGCVSLGGAEPPPSLLTLTPEASAPAGAAKNGTGENALTVIEPAVAPSIAVTRVPVQIDDASVAYLKDAVWVERPARLFRRLLSETISARTGRIVVDGIDPTFQTRDTLRGTLHEFGYDARTSSVVVRFDAIRNGDDGTVTTRRFESVVPGVTAQAGPVGQALNRAANDVAGQVANWMAE